MIPFDPIFYYINHGFVVGIDKKTDKLIKFLNYEKAQAWVTDDLKNRSLTSKLTGSKKRGKLAFDNAAILK